MSNIRLCVLAEGQTEENFVNRVLKEHLAKYNVFTSVHCVTTSRDKRRQRVYRGGLVRYEHLKNDLDRWMKQERKNADCWFTTMVDLYAFPTANSPFDNTIRKIPDPYEKVELLENAIREDIGSRRFIPHVQLHEFEALVLVDPTRFEDFFDDTSAIEELRRFVTNFKSPELIDDGETTAPSKQIVLRIREYGYQKAVVGAEIASDIGVDALRENCPHFDKWLTRLERLPTS